jgi:hypothetical protein
MHQALSAVSASLVVADGTSIPSEQSRMDRIDYRPDQQVASVIFVTCLCELAASTFCTSRPST